MKKNKKKEVKTKDFSNAPFKGLKAFSAETPHPPKDESVKPIKPPEPDDETDDGELFLRHVEGVRKLDREPPEKRPALILYQQDISDRISIRTASDNAPGLPEVS